MAKSLYERAVEMQEIGHADLQPFTQKTCTGSMYPITYYLNTLQIQIIWFCNECGEDITDSQLRSISDDVDFDNQMQDHIWEGESIMDSFIEMDNLIERFNDATEVKK